MYLEPIPVALVIFTWGHSFESKKLILKFVNEAVAKSKYI